MITSSASIPVLDPVLYFTSTDGYSYDVDNRPIFNLDSNLRHVNTSLVGIGYGEHASLAGGQLSPGTVVALASNGAVFYPTAAPSTVNPTENIVGLVVGATASGLNRVIWSSKHLDLDTLGLTNLVAGGASGSYLTTQANGNGLISIKTTPNLSVDYVVGRIKHGSYIEINTSTDLIASNAALTIGNAALDNHANMYGLTRLRNLLLYIDMGQTPVQYTKKTVRQSDYYAYSSAVNPMSASISSDFSTILSAGADSTAYGNILDNSVIKESYYQFATTAGSDAVSCGTSVSTWSSTVYNTALPYNFGSQNYELQQITYAGGVDYSTNVALFKAFKIDKYYQYYRSATAPLAGKIAVTATVFNPLNIANQGGEATRIIVWDFYSYNLTTGLESSKSRIILNGDASEIALAPSTSIFPTALITI